MTDDPVLKAVQKFMDAVEARLGNQAEMQRAYDATEARIDAKMTEMGSLLATLETRAGVVGPAGRDGKDGAPGAKGDTGVAGDRGEAGERGADGLHGRDGAPGTPGRDGVAGERGERGADGVAGRDGAVGLAGRDGSPSTVPGPRGEQGERGADGIATREEIESIVEQRMADLQVRTFADVYQGVYENGRVYSRGLLATWGGSLWLSLAETNAKPGETADWRLVVKKGADGRK